MMAMDKIYGAHFLNIDFFNTINSKGGDVEENFTDLTVQKIK